jgi:hopene-associated glycosyltransferase HpnB
MLTPESSSYNDCRMFLLIAGILNVLIWLYLMLARGGFWRVSRHLPLQFRKQQASCRIAAVVPARNEAQVISRSIASLLNQRGDNLIHIFVVDDGSTDHTAEIARQTAAEINQSSSLTVIQGQPLPSGWTGKLWAVQQGIERAQEFKPDFFLLTDADILHSADNLATLVSIAESGPYDLASFMVKLHCDTVAEKFLIPAFVFFFFKLYPPAWISSPHRKTAGAAGGSILIRPAALEQAGGIAAIRSEIIDDCALARAVKRAGGRVWLGLTETTRSLRAYNTFGQIETMIARTAFNQLKHSALMLFAALAGLIAIYLLPLVVLLASRNLVSIALALNGWLLMTAAYLPIVSFYRLNPLWAFTLPFAAIFYMSATVHSAVKFWRGRGGQWKGRSQDPHQNLSH